MAADRDDTAVITEEMPVFPVSWTGQAPPVVMSDNELALLDEVDDDDPGAGRDPFTAPDPPAEVARPSWDHRVASGALIAVILMVAMLPVAFGFALATP